MKVLVTGCCGYIGSHTCVELIKAGYEVVGLDNFSNSKKDVLDRIFMITNEEITFYEGDMQNIEILRRIFSENKITSVIDFAAYKAFGESVSKPIEYYMNNVSSVLNLLKAMKEYDVKNLVFSSSATVYGDPEIVPITEDCKTGGTTNPYGTSKLFVEQILKDTYKADKTNDFCILRYFNPIGAHDSGLLGENPNGIPANLMPYICRVASKKLETLSIYGDDYDTLDGTGVRDYIHVNDLAKAHIDAYEYLCNENESNVFNLGNGKGFSVKEVIDMVKKVTGKEFAVKLDERREGDPDILIADATKIKDKLGWTPQYDLETIVESAWNWHKKIYQD